MTVPAFGEASARGRRQGAYEALAAGGALTAAGGGVVAGSAYAARGRARMADMAGKADLEDRLSAARSAHGESKKAYRSAMRAVDSANQRYDRFGEWRKGLTPEAVWSAKPNNGHKGDVIRLDRGIPGHRALIEEEQARLSASGRAAQVAYGQAGDRMDAAKKTAAEAKRALNGYRGTSGEVIARTARRALGGKIAVGAGLGALAAGIYGIESGRKHHVRPTVQPRFAGHAAAGRKQEIDHGKARAAAYRAGLPAGNLSREEIDSWYVKAPGER